MHQRRLAQLLLRPSFFSVVVTMLVAGIILVAALWPEVASGSTLSPYLYGPYGVFTVLEKTSDISKLTTTFLNSTTTYNVVVLAVAALVATGVYMILQTISKIVVGSYDTWHAMHDSGEGSQTVHKEIGAKLTIRLMGVLIWVAFTYFFWSLLLPYSIFTAYAGMDDLFSWHALHAVLGFVILVASLHVHVVFLRLLLLRPRVFGGKLDILEAMYDAENDRRATIQREAIPRALD